MVEEFQFLNSFPRNETIFLFRMIFTFYGNETDLDTLIGLELQNSATNGNIQDIGANLYQWSANASSLKNHLESQVGHLSDFHVNLAASYGYETWKWACITYAKQLEDKGNVVKASSYFLMVRIFLSI